MKRLAKMASVTVGLMVVLLCASQALAGSVAILSSTVSGGTSSREALYAQSLGHTVSVIDPAVWQTMTQAQFEAFDAIILGDPTCKIGTSYVAAAAANPAWAKAANGNVILIGSDPVYHYASKPGARTLIERGIDFALADAGTGKTGAYVTLSCYYHYDAANTPVSFLDGFGTFAVVGAAQTQALNDVRIVATHPALSGLTSAALSNWYNSVHESFGTAAQSWPAEFEVLAVAASASGNFVAPDGTRGYPYILARGVIPDKCGDGILNPPEECDDGNNIDGDGCDKSCNLEEACPDSDGDGICDADDLCKGNDATGDPDGDGLCSDIDQCPDDPLNDEDNDGFCYYSDNCPLTANPDQKDNDGDGIGDICDDDDDNDGVYDEMDNCQYDANPDQSDIDQDGAGDVCDADRDGDGVIDASDQCLPTPLGQTVNANGCSIPQICPCENGWKNHGAYVKCNAHACEDFIAAGLMTEAEKDAWMSLVGQSECGKK